MLVAVPILNDIRELVRKDPRAQRQIAIAAGLSVTSFSAFMAGRRGLTIENAEKLAGVLGKSLTLGKPAK